MTNDVRPARWKSDVLNCFVGDDHCPVCRFIAGDRTVDIMLAVIRRLDDELASEEEHNQLLLEAMEMVRKGKTEE